MNQSFHVLHAIIAAFIHSVSMHAARELASAWVWVAERWDRDASAELSWVRVSSWMAFSLAAFIHSVSMHAARELGSAWVWVAEHCDRDASAELSWVGVS